MKTPQILLIITFFCSFSEAQSIQLRPANLQGTPLIENNKNDETQELSPADLSSSPFLEETTELPPVSTVETAPLVSPETVEVESVAAVAESPIVNKGPQISGEFGTFFAFYEKPTAVKNFSEFDIGNFNLRIQDELVNFSSRVQWQVGFGFAGDKLRDSDTGERVTTLNRAAVSIFEAGSNSYFKMGLVESPVISLEREFWMGYLFGRDWSGLSERSNLIPVNDFGAQWFWQPRESQFSGGVAFNNGEGYLVPEIGPSKDWTFWLRHEAGDKAILTELFYLRGKYEGLPKDVSDRHRLGLSFYYLGETWDFTIQGLVARDAIDGLTTNGWDGADLTVNGGNLAVSYSQLFRLKYKLNEMHGIYLNVLQAEPDTNIQKNTLTSVLAAYEYKLAENQRFWLGKTETQYSENHSTGVDNKSEFNAGILLKF